MKIFNFFRRKSCSHKFSLVGVNYLLDHEVHECLKCRKKQYRSL